MGRTIFSQEGLTCLYRRRFGMVYQVCLVLMKNVPDAEDAAQTVFRKAMERGEPFRDPEHEKAWLIVTARNECKNQLKHWWRTRRAGEEELEAIAWEQPEDGALWERILALPERERMVILLRFYKNLTQDRVSKVLGVSQVQVSRIERRAVAHLRESLSD